MTTMAQSDAPSAIPPPKRDGFPAATLIAAGIGIFVLGLMTTWAEASTSMKAKLQFNDDVGPLSGKTTWAVIAFAVSWVVLSVVLWKRDRLFNIALVAFGVLTAAGLIGTFPKFFQAFA
jgi:fluoride ion exporter CrcB/FEX